MILTFTVSTPRLNRLERNLKTLDLTSVGNAGVADIKRNIDTAGANIGKTWPPLKFRKLNPKKLKGRKASVMPLRNEGYLYSSIHSIQQGNTVYVIASRTEYSKKSGRRVNIAHIHNEGWKIEVTPKMRMYLHSIGIHLKNSTRYIVIPQREFMLFSGAARLEFIHILNRIIQK
jgi:phage gpG-like protein